MTPDGVMRRRDWAVLIWAVGLVCFTLLMLTWPISPWSRWDWAGQTAAAWVQAVGSVVAIGIAIAIPAMQHRADLARETEAKRIEDARVLGIAEQVAGGALNTFLVIADRRGDTSYGEDDEERRTQREGLSGLLRSLEAFPLLQFPTPRAASAVIGLRYTLSRALLDIPVNDNQTHAGSHQRLLPWLTAIGMAYDSLECLAEQLELHGVPMSARTHSLLARALSMMQRDSELFAVFENKRRKETGHGYERHTKA